MLKICINYIYLSKIKKKKKKKMKFKKSGRKVIIYKFKNVVLYEK